MTCDVFSSLMEGLLQGKLAAEQHSEALRHMESCNSCKLQYMLLQDARMLDEDEELPASFSAKWREAVAQEATIVGKPEPIAFPKRRQLPLTRWMAVAASLVLVLGGTWMLSRQPQSNLATDAAMSAAAPQAAPEPMAAMEPAPEDAAVAAEADFNVAPQAVLGRSAEVAKQPEANYRLRTQDPTLAVGRLAELARKHGGSVEEGDTPIVLTIRVPQTSLEAFLADAQLGQEQSEPSPVDGSTDVVFTVELVQN